MISILFLLCGLVFGAIAGWAWRRHGLLAVVLLLVLMAVLIPLVALGVWDDPAGVLAPAAIGEAIGVTLSRAVFKKQAKS